MPNYIASRMNLSRHDQMLSRQENTVDNLTGDHYPKSDYLTKLSGSQREEKIL